MRKAFNFKNDDGSIWIQYLEAAHEQFIELFPSKNISQQPGQSFFHISLQVDDLDAVLAELKTRGVLCYNGPEGALAKNSLSIYLRARRPHYIHCDNGCRRSAPVT